MIEYKYELHDRYSNVQINAGAEYETPLLIQRPFKFESSVAIAPPLEAVKLGVNRSDDTIRMHKDSVTLEPTIFLIREDGGTENVTSTLKGKLKITWERHLEKGEDAKEREDKDFPLRHAGEWEMSINSEEFAKTSETASFCFTFSTEEATQIIRQADKKITTWGDFWTSTMEEINSNFKTIGEYEQHLQE